MRVRGKKVKKNTRRRKSAQIKVGTHAEELKGEGEEGEV